MTAWGQENTRVTSQASTTISLKYEQNERRKLVEKKKNILSASSLFWSIYWGEWSWYAEVSKKKLLWSNFIWKIMKRWSAPSILSSLMESQCPCDWQRQSCKINLSEQENKFCWAILFWKIWKDALHCLYCPLLQKSFLALRSFVAVHLLVSQTK